MRVVSRGLHEELAHEGRKSPFPHKVARRSFPEELGEPGLVLNLLVENRQGKIVGSMILPRGEVADVGVSPDRAAFRFHQHIEHLFHVPGILRKGCRRAGGDIVEIHHILGKLAAQLVNPGNQRFEMVPVLDAGRFGDFFQPFSL